MVILDTPLLSIVLFGLQHLPYLPARLTVQARGENLLLGLISVENITDAHVQAALAGQDLGDCHLLFRHLVHQLIDLVQQVQPSLGILRPGDSGVNAAGDLVDVVADVMDLRAQGLDLLGGTGLDRLPLDKADQEGPFGQAAIAGLPAQQLVLLWCEFDMKVVLFFF